MILSDKKIFFVSSSVNNEELARFVRSLKVLEHCIQPFLDHCDTDNDNKISSDEWGTCLGLDKSKKTKHRVISNSNESFLDDMAFLKTFCSH
jgi:hypothetical protein